MRDLLQRNKILAEVLSTDQDLHARMNNVLATGRNTVVRAANVAIDDVGAITVVSMVLPPYVLDVPTLRLPQSRQ